MVGIYQKRWSLVQECSASLETLIPDVEAALDGEILVTVKALVSQVEKLRFAFHAYIVELRKPGHWQTLGKPTQEHYFSLLFVNRKETDEFSSEFEKNMNDLQRLLAKEQRKWA